MSELIYGIVLFVMALAVHFLIWRMRAPKNHALALVIIFLAIFAAGVIVLMAFERRSLIFNVDPPHTFVEYFRLFLLFFSLASAYVANYPSIEVDSPSFVMMSAIDKTGDKGFHEAGFAQMMTDDKLVIPRVDDLVVGNMAVVRDGKYVLTPRGKFLAWVFLKHRQAMGKKEKGG